MPKADSLALLAPSSQKKSIRFWNSSKDLTLLPYITLLEMNRLHVFEWSPISDLSFFVNSGADLFVSFTVSGLGFD